MPAFNESLLEPAFDESLLVPETRPERGQRLRSELAAVRQEPAALSDPNAPAPSPVTAFQGPSEVTLMPPGEEYRQFRLPRAGAPGIQPVTTFQGPSEVTLQPEQQARTTGEVLQNTAAAGVEGIVSPMTPPLILGTIAAPEVAIPLFTATMAKSGSQNLAEGLVDLQQGRHVEGVEKLGQAGTELGMAAAPGLHPSAFAGRPTIEMPRSLAALAREPIKVPENLPVTEQPLATGGPSAIQVESPTALPVRETPVSGETVGEGIRSAQEPAGTREGVTAEETGAPQVLLTDLAGNPVEFYSLPRLRALERSGDPRIARAKQVYAAKTIPDLARLAKARFEEMAKPKPAAGLRTSEDIEMARVRALPEGPEGEAQLNAEDIAKSVDTVNVDDVAGYSPVPALVRIIRRAPRDPAMKTAAEQAMQKIGQAAREQGVPLDDIKKQVAEELKAVYGADAAEMAKYYFGETSKSEAPKPAEPHRQQYVDWGVENLPFEQTASVPEGSASLKPFEALRAAGIPTRQALDILGGKKPFPSRAEFEKGVDANYIGDALELRQKIISELSTLGLDVRQAKLPSLTDFTSAREFYQAVYDLEKRMRSEGVSVASALVETGQMPKPFTKSKTPTAPASPPRLPGRPVPEVTKPAEPASKRPAIFQATSNITGPVDVISDFVGSPNMWLVRDAKGVEFETPSFRMMRVEPAETTAPPTPEEQATAQAPKPAPAPETKPAPTTGVRRTVERAPDIIDEIQGRIGKLSLSAARKVRENFKPTGAARKLFSRDTGSAPDVALDALQREDMFRNIETEDALLQAIEDAVAARKTGRGEKSKGEREITRQKEKREDFESALKGERASGEPQKTQSIDVGELLEGDTFKLAGETVKVKEIVIDSETGEAAYVVLDDGRRFEHQTLPRDIIIQADSGTLIRPEESTAYVKPTGKELFGETPFNLAGEKLRQGEPVKKAPVATAQTELFEIQKITPTTDPIKSADAAQKIYGSARNAIQKVESQLRFVDSDPVTKRHFLPEQRARLKQVLALLQERASKESPAPPAGAATETPAVPPGPGAASPSEFAERTAKGAGAMPPTEPPIAVDASANPSPEIVRRAKDFNIFNKANSGQWSFYFGKLGKTAKDAWDKMAITGFRLRENTKRDTDLYVKNLLSSLPREVRKGGGEAFFDVLDGRTMDQIEAQWAGKPNGQSVIDAAQKLKSRLEDIRTTIRDTKREAYNGFLMGLDRPTLSQLFDANISDAIDTSKYSKEMFADALTRNELPDDWGISDGSYLPHIFFGNWKVTAQRGATPEFITRARTPSEAKARIFEYVKANPDYAKADWKVEPDAVVPADILRLTDNRFWRMLNQMKDSLGVSASEIKQAQQGIIGKKSSKQKWFGNLQQREGYKGYSKDYETVMSAYLSGFHRWLELSRLQREVQPMIDQVRAGSVDEIGNRTEGPRPRAAEALEDIMDYMWGKPARSTILFDSFLQNIPVLRDRVKPLALDRYSQFIRSVVPYLTLSTARFAVVNRLQPLQGLYPLVGERIMAQAKRFQHTPEGRKLLDDAGVFFDPGQYGFERGFTGKLSELRERFTGERSNQELAFLAMFQHGTESGLPRGEAINYAKLRGQLLTQFTPNAADIPPVMRGPISGLLLQFKRFPIKQAELLVKMGAQGSIGGLARWFTVMAATGGLSYFLKQAWAPAETREKIRRSITNEYGQTVADAVMYGLPGLANVDLSGSLTIGDEPFGANIYEKIGRTATGPAGGMAIDTATQLLTAAREPTTVTQDALTLLRKFPTTKPIAELIALANSDLDVRNPDGEVKYRKAIKDAIVGIGSFKTASESNLQSAVNGWIAIEKEATSLKNAAFVEMMKPNGNSANALDAIQKFNERWPERAISGPELNRYIHTRAKGMGKTDYERAVRKRGAVFLPEQP